ncbi:hypothetical protein M2351_006745 [Azospirillum canadense]|nr:hypothetical protein [Azospirillum canadense]MCW2242100.1 hypothetical protein [Azospirillum canadense]
MVAIDLDPANQGSDDVALALPVDAIQPLANPRRELVQPADDHGQFACGFDRLGGEPLTFLDLGEAAAQSSDAGLKLGAVEQPFGVAVDQAADPAAQAGGLAVEQGDVAGFGGLGGGGAEPPTVLVRDAAGILQYGAHSLPDRAFQEVAADRWIVAHRVPVESAAIGADAAVIAKLVLGLLPVRARRRLAVVGVAAAPADDQALQQPPWSFEALPLAPTIFVQLLLHRIEHRWIDQRRHGHLDPLVARHNHPRTGPFAWQRMTTQRAQQLGGRRHVAGMAIDRLSDVSGVAQHAVDRRGVPQRTPAACLTPGLFQAAANLAQADALQPYPGKDQAHEPSLFRIHLEPRHAAAHPLGNVTVTEGGSGEGAEQATAGRMAAPAAATFQDLRPFVLRDDALDLQQQVVFGGAAERVGEKGDLRSGAAELFDQEHLMRVTAGQPVRRQHVDALDRPGGDRIAQTLQPGSQQDRAAVALVHIGVVRLQLATVRGDPLAQRRHLAGDGVIAGLLFGRYPRVKRDTVIRHAHLRWNRAG